MPRKKSTADAVESPNKSGVSPQEKATRTRKMNLKKRKRQAETSKMDDETEQIKKKLLKRQQKGAGGSRQKNGENGPERPPFIHKKTHTKGPDSTNSVDVFSVQNPSSYKRMVHRIEESQANKVGKPESGLCLDGPWLCSICGLKFHEKGLGDLFGPYYQKLDPVSLWPPFLEKPKTRKKPGPKPKNPVPEERRESYAPAEYYSDFWYHGDCLVWTAGLLLKGNQIVGVEEHMNDCWQQTCSYCNAAGASISCARKGCQKRYHYACGLDNGAKFKLENLTSYCKLHRDQS